MDEKIRKAYNKFRDDMQHKWENFESKLFDDMNAEEQDIINIRNAFFSFLLEMFCTWHKTGDCVPDIVLVGTRGGKALKIEVVNI